MYPDPFTVGNNDLWVWIIIFSTKQARPLNPYLTAGFLDLVVTRILQLLIKLGVDGRHIIVEAVQLIHTARSIGDGMKQVER